jgi:hypothetical protein
MQVLISPILKLQLTGILSELKDNDCYFISHEQTKKRTRLDISHLQKGNQQTNCALLNAKISDFYLNNQTTKK